MRWACLLLFAMLATWLPPRVAAAPDRADSASVPCSPGEVVGVWNARDDMPGGERRVEPVGPRLHRTHRVAARRTVAPLVRPTPNLTPAPARRVSLRDQRVWIRQRVDWRGPALHDLG